MHYSLLLIAALTLGQADAVGPGDNKRTITFHELKRTHWIHVPPGYDPVKPSPVVLALHGAMMDSKLMEVFSGLNSTADKNNFIVVYPNGTGPSPLLLTWNAGIFPGDLNKAHRADDVKYLSRVLDDVIGVLNVDTKRVYATGMSNGAMMSYRLAAEMSDRIAAIAPVAGTMVVEKYEPARPVSVLHFHGTKDPLVPYNGPEKKKEIPAYLRFRSVDETIKTCCKANGCADIATESEPGLKVDKLKVVRKEYGKGKNDSEVVLYVIESGGHTWPGSLLSPIFLGLSTRNISANEIMWEFFRRHALK